MISSTGVIIVVVLLVLAGVLIFKLLKKLVEAVIIFIILALAIIIGFYAATDTSSLIQEQNLYVLNSTNNESIILKDIAQPRATQPPATLETLIADNSTPLFIINKEALLQASNITLRGITLTPTQALQAFNNPGTSPLAQDYSTPREQQEAIFAALLKNMGVRGLITGIKENTITVHHVNSEWIISLLPIRVTTTLTGA